MDSQVRHRGFAGGRRLAVSLAAFCLLAVGRVAAVTIQLPDTTAAAGDTVSLPLSVNGVGAEGIVSVEISVVYDPAQVSFAGLHATGALLENWLVDTGGSLEGLSSYFDRREVPGPVLDTLKIVGATASDTVTADGHLLYLDFAVSGEVGGDLTIPLLLENLLLNAGSPTAADGSITLVGFDGTVEGAPDPLTYDTDIQITVRDYDEDVAAGQDTVQVRAVNGEQTEDLVAVETDSPGTFVGTLSAIFAADGNFPAQDGIMQVKDGDQISLCYDDLLNGSGDPVERCAMLFVVQGILGSVAATVVAQPADTVRISVVDPDRSIAEAIQDTLTVTVINSRTLEEEMVVLQEAAVGADTFFFGQLFTVEGSGAGTQADQSLNAQRADSLFILYRDPISGTGSPVTIRDTCVVVDPWGDASGNGQLGGLDGAMILAHSVGDVLLSGMDSLAANVDSEAPFSPITSFDASLVLQKRVGLIDHFPVQESTSADHPQPGSGAAGKRPVLERAIAIEARQGHLAVVLDRSGIVAGELLLAGFSGRVEMAGDMGDFLLVQRRTEEGVRVAFAGMEERGGAGELLYLFPLSDDPIRIEKASFNGARIVGRPVEGTSSLPADFLLAPNVPNPFNPETLIRFALPRAGRVRLEIFNAAGQRVRSLVEEVRSAGTHQVIWDGRDGRGMGVAGGVYFYRLQADGFSSVRRMVLIK